MVAIYNGFSKSSEQRNSGPRVGCEVCHAKSIGSCAGLPDEQLGLLARLSRETRFAPRQSIFSQDDVATNVANIMAGTVRLYKLLPDGRRQIIGFGLPGDFLGLSLEDRHSYGAEAISEVTLCEASRESYLDLLRSSPQMLERLRCMTARELTVAQDRMVVLGRRTAREKIVVFILDLRQRWNRVDGALDHVALPMTRKDIADFLGLSFELVSRLLTELAREKLIEIIPEGVRILDLGRLRAVAEE